MIRRFTHALFGALLPLAGAAGIGSPMLLATTSAALACGDETGGSCATDEEDARYMLKQAVAAIVGDEAQALTWFTERSHGFRTEDLYVYCIGPDHIMAAHPNPAIDHTDVLKTLVDKNGFHFAEVMLREAREGRVSDITYLWPRLEAMKPSVKHAMYTRVKDQVCAVGYYE